MTSIIQSETKSCISTTTKYDDEDVFYYRELGIAVVFVWRKIEIKQHSLPVAVLNLMSEHQSRGIVQELTKRNDELHEQVIKLTKEQKERDQLWTAAKKWSTKKEQAASEYYLILNVAFHSVTILSQFF